MCCEGPRLFLPSEQEPPAASDHDSMCLVALAPQVPNMKEYIAKWGRRVGFDLDAVPTEDKKTHAIIQVPALPWNHMLHVCPLVCPSYTADVGLPGICPFGTKSCREGGHFTA